MAQPDRKRLWRVCTMGDELFELLTRLAEAADVSCSRGRP